MTKLPLWKLSHTGLEILHKDHKRRQVQGEPYHHTVSQETQMMMKSEDPSQRVPLVTTAILAMA